VTPIDFQGLFSIEGKLVVVLILFQIVQYFLLSTASKRSFGDFALGSSLNMDKAISKVSRTTRLRPSYIDVKTVYQLIVLIVFVYGVLNFYQFLLSLNLTEQLYSVLMDINRDVALWVALPSIAVFEALCAIIVPIPSELPLLLYPRISLVIILLTSAIGKGIGAYIVCMWFTKIEELANKFQISRFFWTMDRIEGFIRKKGFIGYLMMQSIPFAPMRSSIYAYSVIHRDPKTVMKGAFFGTIIRNLLMFLLLTLGYISFKSFIK
jgi:hypothetical protein